jgi:hypothetical protein
VNTAPQLGSLQVAVRIRWRVQNRLVAVYTWLQDGSSQTLKRGGNSSSSLADGVIVEAGSDNPIHVNQREIELLPVRNMHHLIM